MANRSGYSAYRLTVPVLLAVCCCFAAAIRADDWGDSDFAGGVVTDGGSEDCNGNGVADADDISGGASQDCQPDGIPDECQLSSTGGPLLTEDFDDVTTLTGDGWAIINQSVPLGAEDWFQGNALVFHAHAGATNAYIAANYESAGAGTGAVISNWLLTPVLTLQDGAMLRFYTRTNSGSTFPDRLQVRMSLAGSSADVGANAESVGVFTAMLLEINADQTVGGYPEVWTLYEVALSGITTPTTGRLAFRYFVTDAGPDGENSSYVGIDTVRVMGSPDNDCNANDVPDECDIAAGTSQDCNANGVPDECDLAGGTSADCNSNSIPDECDIASGASDDANTNGVPDECETPADDCNNNGVSDADELAADPSLDCNTNGVLDECDVADGTSPDCNANDVPDECDIAAGTSADCNNNSIPDACDIASGASIDANTNGVPDECEIPGGDCNDNGISDVIELSVDPSLDCNDNGVLDECDIADGTSQDCQPDGTPDECQVGDPTPLLTEAFDDVEALATDGWTIVNASSPRGETDWFQGNATVFSAFDGAAAAYVGANFESTGSATGAVISNWLLLPALTLTDGAALTFYTRTKSQSNYPDRLQVRMSLSGSSADVGTTAESVGVFDALLLEINAAQEQGAYPEDWTQYRVLLSGIGVPVTGRLAFRYYVTEAGAAGSNANYIGIDSVSVSPPAENDCNANGIPDSCDVADGTSPDCNGNLTPDECEIASGSAADCNANGVPDSCDVASGTSLDCDDNGVPDSCDIASGAASDCNANGIPDLCDLASGAVADCNENGIPDVCETATGIGDCNDNGIPDACETDCNGNGQPDDCDIADGTAKDCNGNGVPDSCDIADGTSVDENSDGIPDECQAPPDDDENPTNGNKVIDRTALRAFLALLFNVPMDGRLTFATLPLHFFGPFGIPMTIAMLSMEMIDMPARIFMFEISYAILDAVLP